MAVESNKRNFTRVATMVDAEVIGPDGTTYPCLVGNVSLNGVLLSGSVPLADKCKCDVRLLLRGVEPPIPIEAKGTIRRSREGQLAVAFREIDGDSYEHLRRLVLENANDPDTVETEFDSSVGINKQADDF